MASQTGRVREQAIELEAAKDEAASSPPWRRIEIELDVPTEAGDTCLVLWGNLPPDIAAHTISQLYRKRWLIEAMFGKLEWALQSENTTLDHPRGALLGFAAAVLAYNVLVLLKRCVQQAHRQSAPELAVSVYHLAVHVASDYKGMLIALQPQEWQSWSEASPERVAQYLLHLAAQVRPRSVAAAKRGPRSKSLGAM